MTWVWLGLTDTAFSGVTRSDTSLCRCHIQLTWFSVNKRPGVVTTDGLGVWRGVVFVERWKQFGFTQERERLEIRNKKEFIYSPTSSLGGIKGGGKGQDGEGIGNSTGGQTRLVEKESLSFIEIAIKKMIDGWTDGQMGGWMDMQINSGTRMIGF